jgi:feruloyl-CoA synthase
VKRLLLTTTIVLPDIIGKAGPNNEAAFGEDAMTTVAARDASSLFATPATLAEHRADGSILLRSPEPLREGARCVGDWLEQWARQAPDNIFLAERAGSDAPWTAVTYAQALRQVRAAASWILAEGLGAERPVAILSDNSIDHALLALAAQHVGVPSAAISPAYSLMSKDFDKLKTMIALLEPGAIYVSATKPFAAALAAIRPLHSAQIISGNAGDAEALAFRSILATAETPDVAKAFAAVGPDTIAKFLFTSGSTGTPKAVINTQRMLTSSQEAKAQTWTFLEQGRGDLVILDWLPWSHTFGANHNFNLVLRNGGSFYIDGGKPVPGLFATSLSNLHSVMPTVYFNVPRGFDMLIAALRSDEGLRRRFFGEVKFAFYAGAALPQNLWDALAQLSVETVGGPLPMVSAWGSTETSPLATDCHFLAERSGNIGVPIPGTELKLVSSGDKLEVRVRGPNVTPGYWKAPELTRQAFDEEGFYRIGDAVTFADPKQPARGLFFDGRVAEDFKLNSGTWVSVGTLRVAGIAALAPLAQDIVVAGHGGDEARFLVFPNLAACRAHAGLGEDVATSEVLAHENIRTAIAQGLARLKQQGPNSSGHATRALLLAEPPSVDGSEITDKGYINQRAVLTRRADALARLNDDACAEWIGCG